MSFSTVFDGRKFKGGGVGGVAWSLLVVFFDEIFIKMDTVKMQWRMIGIRIHNKPCDGLFGLLYLVCGVFINVVLDMIWLSHSWIRC